MLISLTYWRLNWVSPKGHNVTEDDLPEKFRSKVESVFSENTPQTEHREELRVLHIVSVTLGQGTPVIGVVVVAYNRDSGVLSGELLITNPNTIDILKEHLRDRSIG